MLRFAINALLFATLCCQLMSAQAGQTARVGDTAPNWLLSNTKNEAIVLHQETASGHDVVMFFWASWCSICETFLPQVEALKAAVETKNLPVKFYALQVWDETDPQPYIEAHKLSMETLIQADNVAQRYGVKLSPGIVIVGKDKKIKYVADSNTKPEKIIEQAEAILLAPSTKPNTLGSAD